MPPLPDQLLTTFENEVVAAREAAEKAAAAALTTLAVERDRPFDTMPEPQRQLRRALRARARQLGGGSQEEGTPRLVEEIAYEQWHRLLFSRFLAENNLLMHPEWGVPVSLEECAELAPEEGAEDEWELAARYAVAMLPGIFLLEDPALQVTFAPEGQQRLEQIVNDLPRIVFTADDSLGWAYQFWQSKKKDEVNRSERKIGGADIAPVTQLFTEDYMVKFLLHNSLGAWWAARHPDSPLLKTFDYLRFREDGTPAAGTFDGWPETAAEVTMMDPCCGSGHFVVAGFDLLVRMRMEEEGLSAAEAGDAVIRDNLFGLEIDPRCTQIAAFNLALAAWKHGGYRQLPLPNIACTGVPVKGQLEEWVKLAGDDEALQRIMKRLYHLFRNAPDLGSLINPAHIPVEERMFVGDYERVEPLLSKSMQRELRDDEPTAVLFGEAVRGVARGIRFLSGSYDLVATNVPYLGFKKQDATLKVFSESHYPDAKMCLSTVFMERARAFLKAEGSYALVTPQNWLSQHSYKALRCKILTEQTFKHLSWLGSGAFGSISGEIVKPVLVIIENHAPTVEHLMSGIDAVDAENADGKDSSLRSDPLLLISQQVQVNNPDQRISLVRAKLGQPLEKYAVSPRGIVSGDSPYWIRYFWEVILPHAAWRYLQSTVSSTVPYGGREPECVNKFETLFSDN